MVACQGESVLGGQSGANRGGVEPFRLAGEGSRGGGDVRAEGEAVGREGAVVVGDVGSIAAHAGGDGGAVDGAAVVVVVGEAVGVVRTSAKCRLAFQRKRVELRISGDMSTLTAYVLNRISRCNPCLRHIRLFCTTLPA